MNPGETRTAIKAADLLKHIRNSGGKIPDETWRRWCAESKLRAFRAQPKFPLIEPHSRAPYFIPKVEAKTMCVQWANSQMPDETLWQEVTPFDPRRVIDAR